MKKITLVALVSFCVLISSAQNVGIGNTAPASKLDVSGDLSLREGTAIATITANTITLPTAKNSVYRITASSPNITTIGGGNDGILLTLIFAGTGTMTLTNSSGNILTNTGSNLVSSTAAASVTLIYNTSMAKWIVSAAQGFNTSASATTHILSLSGSTLTSTVNGVAPTALLSALPIAGDVTGTLAGTTVDKIQGVAVNAIAPTNGQVLTYNTAGSNWAPAAPTTGTVTSVSGSGGTTGLTLTGGPITSSGTLTLGGSLATANGGMGANMTAGAIGAIPYANSTTSYSTLADVVVGSFLTSGGVGIAPSWTAASSTALGFGSWTKATTATTPALKTDNQYVTGNVGIGNFSATAPGYQLTLSGAGAVSTFAVDNGNTFVAKNTGGTYENYLWPRWTDNVMYMNFGSGGMNIRSNSSTSAIFINSSNQVGIGTTTPGAELEIIRGSDATQLTGTSADVVIQALNAATGDARLAFVSNDNVGNSGAGIIDGWANSYGGGTSKAVEISFPTSQGGSAGQVNGNIAFSVNKGTAGTLTEAMRVASNGYVGIGTTGPGCPLDVSGFTSISSSGYAYGLSSVSVNGNYNSAENVSIRANGNVQAGSFEAVSDARIKNVMGYSDPATDLATLNRIKITDYLMRDKVRYGRKQSKKVIAQQVREVYPLAVKISPMGQFIPNIYQYTESYTINDNEVMINLAESVSDTNIKVGVTCRFYMYDTACKEIELKGRLTSFSPTQLHITTEKPLNQNGPLDNMFVYGTEIHDLLTVDYDAISMLNVSATQELSKKLAGAEEMIQLLRSENIRLQACTREQADLLKTMKTQINAINEKLSITSTK